MMVFEVALGWATLPPTQLGPNLFGQIVVFCVVCKMGGVHRCILALLSPRLQE